MNKRLIFLAMGILTIASLAFVIAEIPAVSFIDPTPSTNQTGNSIYVNLSTTSALQHYSFVNFDSDLLLWARIDDNNGSVVYDNSTYRMNGTILNGALVNVSGKFGKAFGGDGYNNYISFPDSSVFDAIANNDRLTVCAWVYPYSNGNSLGTIQGVLGQFWSTGRYNYNNKSFAIAEGIAGVGKYALYVSNDGNAWQDAQTNSALTLNTWAHLCGTMDGTTARMYVNGVLQTDTGTISAIYNPQNTPFTIGTYLYAPANPENDSTIYYNGSIDEVLLYARALSQNEIRAIYNSSAYRFEKNYTSLTNGSHLFTGYAINSEGNTSSVSRTIYTGVNESAQNDTTPPSINFVSPTETSGQTINRTYILINVTASDANLTNITIYLFNSSSGLINSTTTLTSPNYVNYTNLVNGTYYFNATAYDGNGNKNSTETRTITINTTASQGGGTSNDTTPPNIQFVSPTPTNNVSGNSIYANLSTSDASEHYSFVDFDNDLVFWMKMDDYSGNTIYDNSTYGNNGTLVNGSYITKGYYKNATGFDGYNDEIKVSDSASLNSISTTDRVTVCAWINQTGVMTGKYGGIAGQYGNEASENGGNNRGYLLAKSGTDYRYEFMMSQDGATREGVTSSTTFNLNQWYHICGVYNGTKYLLYVNGALDNSTTATYTSIYDSTSYLGIGNYGYRAVGYENGPVYNGSIDEVLIFNRALPLGEIKAIYNSSAYQFEHNYTSLTNGSHSVKGYAVDIYGNFNSTSRTITSGNASSGNTTLQLTLNSPTTQENTFAVWISTNAAASMCWFTSNNGITNTTMFENSSTTFYYEDFDYGNYSISFYCQNVNGTGTRTDNFQFKRSYVISDHYYTNSQGLKIYFDFGFNYTSENGGLVIIPDSWTAVKDTTWVTDAENYYISRGYAAAPVDTRGKGSSEGTKDAFGWECLDIYELVQYLISTSPYNAYVNSSRIFISGASGAGGKAGVCTGKYPDAFSAGYSSVGVLNLTRWWYTAGAADVAEIEVRVGCDPNECPEAYLARDGAYLGYNTQSAMKAKTNADDDRVSVNCSRDYNRSLTEYGKTINYTENPTGGHTADFTHSSEWFTTYSNKVYMPISGDLRIGGYVHTKNFSIYLNEAKVNHTVFVAYNISGNSRIFNITTLGFNGTAEINIFDLEASTNYSINESDSLRYLLSNANGDMEFNVTLSNYTSEIINISKVVASSPSPYCGDGSCNNGETCSSCSADCGSCGGGGGGGGGGIKKLNATQTNMTQPKTENAAVYFESIPSMIVNPGENKKIVLNVKNIGDIFLNLCKLKGTGERASWISSDAVKDLSPGQNSEFVFNLAVPQNIKAGKYEIGVSIDCQELKQSTIINTEIIEKKLGLQLLKAERKDDKLAIRYLLSELSGQAQEVNVEIVLIGENGDKLANITEIKSIVANSKNNFESLFEISKIAASSFNLIINANSKIASASLKENIVLNKGKLTGFISLTGQEISNIAIAVLIIAFIVFAFFIVRRIFRLRGIHKRRNIISAIIAGIRYYDVPDLSAPHHQNAPHHH